MTENKKTKMAPGDQENRIHLFRLQILIIDGGLLVLRNIIDQTIAAQGITLRACLNNEKPRITQLHGRGVIIKAQYDVLFPVGGQDPTTSDMDISLIICLLTNLKCFGLNKKFQWNAAPVSTDVTIEADICRLRNSRNKISHISTTTGIESNAFATLWNEMEQTLVRLSTPGLNLHQTIAGFKSCPLDPEEDRRIKEKIKKWNDYEADVYRLKQEMGDVKENVIKVMRELDDVKGNVTEVKRDLDDVKGNVTEAKKDLDDVKGNVTEVKRELEDVKRRQETDFPVQKEEEKYQIRKNVIASIVCTTRRISIGCNVLMKFKTYLSTEKPIIYTTMDPFFVAWELRGDLIKFYRKRCSSLPISPLREDIETPLTGFYVMPDIVAVRQKSLTCYEEERTPIKSLKDLFSTGSGEQQEIYLSADAGFGKTAFSKYLAIMWCQAHCHHENYACFKDDVLETLLDFEFLFLVFLRDFTSDCKIDDMIEKQITEELPSSASLDEVLRREKCLIILDGLDEWTHPDNSCSKATEKIPHRYERGENCVILTTTRPWKLGVSNLKTSQINTNVAFDQLSEESSRQLVANAIRVMTNVRDDKVLTNKTQAFNEVIRDRGIEHMQVIPLLLMYIVCLWCNDIPLGNSKHEIYTNMIDFLLLRTSKEHPEVQTSCEFASEIPEYFKGHECFTKFYSLITSLAELAYQTLFKENRENTLVFDRTVAEKYLKADDMTFSLLSGILSEKRMKNLMKPIIKVSFSHKTVQEFFAAIFINSNSDAQKTVVEKCRNVQDILDMSKICEFVSKINADRMCAILNDLMPVINEDEKIRDYRTRIGVEYLYNTPLYDIQDMFMSCLQEMPERENVQLYLQDFFIVENTEHSEHLQRLLKQNKTNIKSLYIDISFTSISLRKIIDLFSLTDLSHIQKLYFEGDWCKAGINLILFPSLQYVTFRNGEWTNDEENLSKNLARCQNIQYLYIRDFKLSHKVVEPFLNFISGQTSMKELTLQELDCKEHGHRDCKRWNLDLSKHSTLTKLDLQRLPRLQLNITTPSLVNVTLFFINLDGSSLSLSRDMLNIERVVLIWIEMSAGSLQNLISVLENLPKSITVSLYAIEPYTEYKDVREFIRSSQSFQVIQDCDWQNFKFKTIKQSIE